MKNHEQQGTDLVKPLTISRFLYGAVITGALAFGAIGGLLMLFMADMFFDVGPDPAIRDSSVQAVDARVAELEARLKTQAEKQPQENSLVAQELSNLKESYSAALQETSALKDALTQQYADSGMQDRVAHTMLGITQLKHAHDEDTSLQPGIETLQQVFTEGYIYDRLEELKQTSQEPMPSRIEILSDLDAFRYDKDDIAHQDDAQNTQEQASQNTDKTWTDKTWKERAFDAAKTLVSISPTAQIVNEDTLGTIRQAVLTGDFTLAESLSEKLPESPRKKLLHAKLVTRAKTERTINSIVSKAGEVASGGSKGSLY